MKNFNAYVAYIKDNPQHYWFRRKVFGWGWTPATKEGWLVVLAFVSLLLMLAWRVEEKQIAGTAVVWQFLIPAGVVITALIFVCVKKGEPPRWQWGIPKKYCKYKE